MKHDDCIFCKIIAGEIPSAKVYEDDDVYAFLDISQVTTGHTLVIPKTHATDIFEIPEDVAAKLFARIPKISNAVKEVYNPKGVNLLNNNGIFAGQSVYHLHIHIIPRYDDNDGFNVQWKTRDGQFYLEELQDIAKEIHDAI